MNRAQLIGVFKQIVKDMGQDPGLQINTFAVIEDALDLKANSFGKTYEDYLNGNFWSRDWADGGASADDIKGQFPVLAIEQKSVQMEDLNSDNMIFPVSVVIVDKVAVCDSCPQGYVRTADEVQENTLIMMRRVFKELFKYRLYSYEFNSQTYEIWLTEDRINYLLSHADGEVDSINGWEVDFEGLLETRLPVKVSQWGNWPELRGHWATFSLNVCETVDLSNMYYNYIDPDTLAKAICKTC